MSANAQYWKEYWKKRSQVKGELVASGWGDRDIKEYLYDLSDISKKLELKSSDSLLNIGCGNGLMEIVLSSWIKKISSVDFSPGMVRRAKINNKRNNRTIFFNGSILDLSFLKKQDYDKILCNSVMQYLSGADEIVQAFKEIKKVSKKESKILISANPDESRMDEFLSGYDKLSFTNKEKKTKKEINKLSLWTKPAEIKNIASRLGFKAKILKMDSNIWQSWYMYDLLMWR